MPGKLTRAVLIFYLATLALLPWAWFPPFPWLHEHAQWSDAVFALAFALWVLERAVYGKWPRPRPRLLALALYFGFAALSCLLTGSGSGSGATKLLGIAELCLLAIVTSDLASRPRVLAAIARVIALTSLVTAVAAIAGLLLFYAGIETQLVGTYGDLLASKLYARVEGGFYQPNLLASFCIFASAVIARKESQLSTWLRRVTLVALSMTIALTFSRGILGFILAAIIRNAHTPARRRLAVAFAVFSIAIIAGLTLWNLLLDPSRPMDARLNEQASSSRYQSVTSSLRAIIARPLTGSGPGSHPGSYRDLPFDAHLTPVNIAATLGIPALIAFTSLIALVWGKRRRPVDLALWGGIAGLALDALAQDVEDFRHVWVIIGLADANTNDPILPSRLAGNDLV